MRYLFVIILIVFTSQSYAQSYAFGIKGGSVLATQKWGGFDRDLLFVYHGIAFIESAPEDNKAALFAQLGYHQRGSAIRGRNAFFVDQNGIPRLLSGLSQKFVFNNIALSFGAKKKFDWNGKTTYYSIGLRGEYTLNTNLADYRPLVDAGYFQYPFEEAVNKINYGFLAGGGIEFPFSELVGAIVELTVNPDLSLQYNSAPAQGNLPPTPFNPGGMVSIPERRVTNISIELTVGFRFLNKVVYID